MLERLFTVDGWILFGLLGQACFSSRFLVQWVASERSGRSTVPNAFWWFSLAGEVILLNYALWYRHDLVFTLGQAAGLLVYARNLALIRRAGGAESAPQGVAEPGA